MPIQNVSGIGVYLFYQYMRDPDLSALKDAANSVLDDYVAWFSSLNLPIYTEKAGTLLDWVASSVCGVARPTIISGGSGFGKGGYGRGAYGAAIYGDTRIDTPANAILLNDDYFKRVITWRTFRGDGFVFSAEWIKRRVGRFLVGANGTAPDDLPRYNISVMVGGGICVIRLISGTLVSNKSQGYGKIVCGRTVFGVAGGTTVSAPAPVYTTEAALALKGCVESGILDLPYQYKFTVLTE